MLRVYSTNRSENASFNMVFSALEKVHLYYICGGEYCLCFLRGNNIIYRFRQASKRSSHFFPARLFNKTKAPTMDKVRGNINGFSFATSPCPCRGLIIR